MYVPKPQTKSSYLETWEDPACSYIKLSATDKHQFLINLNGTFLQKNAIWLEFIHSKEREVQAIMAVDNKISQEEKSAQGEQFKATRYLQWYS